MMEATYRKLIVDGLCVKVWKGVTSRRIIRLLGLSGLHIEKATKEEYDQHTAKKKQVKPKTQLSLF